MKKIEFLNLEEVGKVIKTLNKDYQLLTYFVSEFDIQMLKEYLPDIESVASGEKTFDDIQDTDSYWDFGEGAGYFECDKKTAYLTCWKDSHTPEASNIEMPLKELIGILKDWKKFLEKK